MAGRRFPWKINGLWNAYALHAPSLRLRGSTFRTPPFGWITCNTHRYSIPANSFRDDVPETEVSPAASVEPEHLPGQVISPHKGLGRFWTKEEIDILRHGHSQGLSLSEINQNLPGRTLKVCRRKIQALTPPYRPRNNFIRRWTADEVKVLTEALEKGEKIVDVAQKLGRSAQACYSKLHNKAPEPYRPWSQKETEMMFQGCMEGHTFEDIAQKLGRSEKACRMQYERRRAPPTPPAPYSPQEIEIMKQGLMERLTIPQIAVKLGGRGGESIRAIARIHGIIRPRRRFSSQEISFLKQSVEQGHRIISISQLLGRNPTVCSRVLGQSYDTAHPQLYAAQEHPPWSKDDIEFLKLARAEGQTFQQVVEKLGRSTPASD